MKLSINNVNQFFNLQRSSANSLKPGMLYMFEYTADNVHDKRPLIWVLEVKGNRRWGLNLHYNFSILADIIAFKEKELKNPSLTEKQKEQDEKLKKEEGSKTDLTQGVPSIVDTQVKNNVTNTPSTVSLEDFSSFPIGKNSDILRNYLYKN